MVVSNPPYVTDGERNLMRPNVLNHEPALALFVPDNDPLKFYRAIAKHGQTLLRPGGALYFEINEQFGSEMLQMLHTEGYTGAELRGTYSIRKGWCVHGEIDETYLRQRNRLSPAGESRENPGTGAPAADEFVCEE